MLRLRKHLALVAAMIAIAAHAALVTAMIASSARSRPAPVAVHTDSEWHIIPLPPPAKPVREVPMPPPPDALGEKNGKGESIASVDSPDVARSPRPADFEQAWKRREPTLTPPPSPANVAKPAAEAVAEQPKSETDDAAADTTELASRQATALPFGTLPMPAQPEPTKPATGTPEPDPQARTTEANRSAQPTPTEQMPAAQPDAAAANPSPPTDATPAPQGPSDLDAFAQNEGVDFSSGGMQARRGREVKLVRPRVDLSFMADATALSGKGIDVTLQIQTDEAGKPRRVDIVKSSGSSTIDDAVRQAAYASWFGAPMPDRFPFTVRFLR